VLDAEALSRLRNLDPTGAAGLMKRLLGAFEQALEKLLFSLDPSTPETLPSLEHMRHVAHTLKSSAASLGGLGLSGMCAQVEAQCRAGEVPDLPEQILRLQSEARRMLTALEQTFRLTP
jgi:HPt (histidine-containing phosphotransfer) domain-containing protein